MLSPGTNTPKSTEMGEMQVKDSNGNILEEGDAVIIIKSLKVKGGNTIKQGTVVKNIRLTAGDEEVEGRVDKVMMVIKTCYVKKHDVKLIKNNYHES